MLTHQRSHSRLRLAVLAFAQFLIAIDYNIVYVALPDIGRDLGFSAQSLQWVVSGYAVGFGGFLLLGGRAVDRLGARRVFLAALGLYGAASLVGGLSDGQGALVGARVVQGMGGALLFPATLTLIVTSFAEGPERGRALAVWGAAGSSGLAAGALAGGVLTQALGWSSVFLVNVPLAAIAVVVALRALAPDAERWQTAGFDLSGALIGTAGVTLLVFGLVSGPDVGWTSGRTLGSVLGAVVLMAAFIAVEARAEQPLLPLGMLRRHNAAATLAVIFVYTGALSTVYYLLTTYFQGVRGYDALPAGLGFVPLGLLAVVGAGQLSTRAIARWGFGGTLAVGMASVAVGTALIAAAMTTGGSYWALLPGIAIWGLAGGMTFSAMFGAAADGVPAEEQGVASGLASTAQQVGAAVGLALLVAVANKGLDLRAAVPPTTSDVVHGLRAAGWVAAAATLGGAAIAVGLIRVRRPVAAQAAGLPSSPE